MKRVTDALVRSHQRRDGEVSYKAKKRLANCVIRKAFGVY